MGFVSDFKAFAMRGNVMDMAVGVIIGGAFGKIVSSFVGDVIMPAIGMLLGNVDFTQLSLTLREAVGDKPAVVLAYGNFIQNIVDFLIIALCIFMMIRLVNKAHKKKEEVPAPPAPTKDQQLLEEIRDLLKKDTK